MANNFLGKAAPLTQHGFDEVLSQLDSDAPSLWALLTVETRGFGYLSDRRPKILFERHIFHKRTNGLYSDTYADISSHASGGYQGDAAEYGRLERAMQLDRQAALESTSWGLGQIMGFNAVTLGYLDAEDMVTRFLEGEDGQLDGSCRFIANNSRLKSAFQHKQWAKVAFFYNGAAYAKKAYHTKLKHFCDLYAANGTPSIAVRAAQAHLTYLGLNPRGVDGIFGNDTRAAVIAFQQAQGIAVTEKLDDETMLALASAAGG